ncbi:ABC-type dipeptide/oligopeptide/nickel transport system, permease component [Bernardetia litoralis DSM 6794]|uniref:ABC-type dipeptide/oligopeptide/nickel transport system, permease component n=1 Tax=Bernardetia litoralis (strain ATCC 23117 / DSM 6794 / NBRC 15988 / NCIMB 1366 / Fx l1 / Sio-4) TaxID=880071 RepID=I4AK57_BERLS|nr:ABC transporter permease [Bernardetia litoralis]AFM04342.1 ABC-type dipeptide/oligopeptide/nickel transport system, permease component [Bernardetia litoralis DSM 6794]
MIAYFLKKLGYGFLVIFGVTVVVFFIFHALPGDPSKMIAGSRSTPETIAIIKNDLGLDKPLPTQFTYYINDLSIVSVHEDTKENEVKYDYFRLFRISDNTFVIKKPYLRKSYYTDNRVDDMLFDRVGATLVLSVAAMIFATFFGVIFGIICALKQNSFIDHALVSISVFGISTPSFVAAIFIALIFGYYLSEYTGLDMTGSLWILTLDGKELALKNIILPALTLGLRPLAIITQLTRSSMIEELCKDYVRTAKAKGLPQHIVIFKHTLKNAINPVVTAISNWLATLIAGAFFVEYVFSWKGLGWLTIDAVQKLDLPVVMGATLVVAVIFVFITLIVDLLYALLDPRVRA